MQVKGKNMGVLQELHQNSISRYGDTEEYPGAIKRDKLVLALRRNNEEWALAKILEIRKKPEPNSEDEEEALVKEHNQTEESATNPEANGEVRQGKEENITHAKVPVQYYVNYLNEARRMDRWVEENMVKINDDKVDELHEEWKVQEQIKAEEQKNATFLANDEHHNMTEQEKDSFMSLTRLKTIEFLQLGEITIETWYHSDFPKEYHCKILYTCPFCLHFFTKKRELEEHSERCEVRTPPGDEIYRDRVDSLSMFEFDAK